MNFSRYTLPVEGVSMVANFLVRGFSSPVVGVVQLYKAPIDKVVAHALIELQVGKEVSIVAFHDTNECSQEQLVEWEDAGIYPIDIGPRKYHNVCGSATEYVVRELGMAMTPVVLKLVALINENNKTGNLKGGEKVSIPWLIRELYELSDEREHHEQVMREAICAVKAWMVTEATGKSPPEGGDAQRAAVRALQKRFPHVGARLNGASLTRLGSLLRFLYDLAFTNAGDKEIEARLNFWLDGYECLQAETALGQKQAEALVDDEANRHHVGEFKVLAINTPGSFVTKAASKMADILVVRSLDGHSAVMTKSLDLGGLAKVLKEVEPERWYHDPKGGHLINGGRMYAGVQATSLSLAALLGLVQKHPPMAVRRQQNRQPAASRR